MKALPIGYGAQHFGFCLRRGPLSLLAAATLVLSGCGSREEARETPSSTAAPLKLDRDFVNPNDPTDTAEPARDYTLFEVDPVRPIAVLEKSGLVAVADTDDDFLEIFEPRQTGVKSCGSVKVGMRPVAVAVIRERRTDAELWVVNHISDSISVVRLDTATCQGEVKRTIYVGDEPRDIVVAEGRVFVTTAHRGQHHPVESARSGEDLVLPPSQKLEHGLADVFVFDPDIPTAPPSVVNLFTDTPRALAVGDGVVYAAGFHTGNRTAMVAAELVAQRGVESLVPLLARDAQGNFVERQGELELAPFVARRARIDGGLRAVVGRGRCMPDPREGNDGVVHQALCVETDSSNRVQRVLVQKPGEVVPSCQCTSGDGTLQPTTSLIVRFFDSRRECGSALTTFPDGVSGCWLDAAPGGVATPAAHEARQAPPMEWNGALKFSLPDQDVFAIDARSLQVKRAFSGVGTILFDMAVEPKSGRLFVTNTDAQNLTRFEGHGENGSTSVIGHLHESRITTVDPRSGRVEPVHLNGHIDYGRCCDRVPGENEKSLAFPTSGVFTPDGSRYFFTALGSDKLGAIRTRAVGAGFDNARARRRGDLAELAFGDDPANPSGPVALALDAERNRLYVKTHFSNELVVVDPEELEIRDRERLPTPEPDSVSAGRHVLYNARLTSSHGDSACASCHVFGNFDSLSWDLGDPDGVTVKNPGPFAVPTEFIAGGIGRDPNTPVLTPDFRSNKGPMSTQTLRGLANHGAQHWRGDRVRRFQDQPGEQPNFGTMNEDNSFGEFDVAIRGLNGNDVSLDPGLFQAFTNFSLQLTLPPNPVRHLDDSLTLGQAAARALYFGCASMTDDQFATGTCTATDGSVVEIDAATHACVCERNAFVRALRAGPEVRGFAAVLQGVVRDANFRAALAQLSASIEALSPAQRAALAPPFAEFAAASDALAQVSLTPTPDGVTTLEASTVIARASGTVLAIVRTSTTVGAGTGTALLDSFVSALSAPPLPADSPLRTPAGLTSALESAFAVSNSTIRVWMDEAARGTSGFRNLREDCSVTEIAACRLRVTDTFETCNGCHRLDRDGNAEFSVYRPGFFGTSGEYSFENESQILKVPHLRNLYQKVGMFGQPQVPFFLPESILGERRGGPFAAENAYLGPQVRGFGFFHDGSTDTVARFHGAVVFARRTAGTVGPDDPGNPDGMDMVLPAAATRAACIQSFREAPLTSLAMLPEALREPASLCVAAGPLPLPDVCFTNPGAPECQEALALAGSVLGDPNFSNTFTTQILPLCFQFGSVLEQGSEHGVCFPEGLAERLQMESFMLAFDSNLRPMVGQQLTLDNPRASDTFLTALVRSAARGDCDLGLRQRQTGYLVVSPNAAQPGKSVLLDGYGRSSRLERLSSSDGPVTFTCYPPQPNRAEARRSSLDRDADGVSDALELAHHTDPRDPASH